MMKTINNIKHYIELRHYKICKKKFPLNTYEDLVADLCYDRDFCKSIGVDYNRMNQEDVNKIKDYVEENVFRRRR